MEVTDEAINILEHNLLLDDYLTRNKLTMAELARSLGVPKTTSYCWIETEKKKEQCEKYDLKQKGLDLHSELDLIKHKLLIYKDRVKDRRFKVDDKARGQINEIKDLFIWLSYSVMVVKEKI